jgi:hypothetical protein
LAAAGFSPPAELRKPRRRRASARSSNACSILLFTLGVDWRLWNAKPLSPAVIVISALVACLASIASPIGSTFHTPASTERAIFKKIKRRSFTFTELFNLYRASSWLFLHATSRIFTYFARP